MNSQPSFKQGEPSKEVAALLEHIQFADASSPDIDEDNRGQSWGHYQFTAGGLSPSSSLTTWQKIGNVDTALKLVAAALKTCQDAQVMCANAGAPKTSGFISDIYLEQILDCLEKCWDVAGGVSIHVLLHVCVIHFLCISQLLLVSQSFLSRLLIAIISRRVSKSNSSCRRLPQTTSPQLPQSHPRSCPPLCTSSQLLTRNSRKSPQQHYMRCVGFSP